MLIFHYMASKSHLRRASRGVPSREAATIKNKILIYVICVLFIFLFKNKFSGPGAPGVLLGGPRGEPKFSLGGKMSIFHYA